MDIQLTDRSTYAVTWPGGRLWLNLVPMNTGAAGDNGMAVGYAAVRPEGVLSNSIADLVGIVGLELDGCPRVPRICWDNREHHFWDGFDGAFEPRNVVVNAPFVELTSDRSAVRAGYYYIANRVRTRVEWVLREAEFVESKPVWDTFITIENLSGRTLRNYLHFLACYHQPGQNCYWSADGGIQPCTSGGFTSVADADQEMRLRSSPYHGHMERYRGSHTLEYRRHRQPVLLAQSLPWYGGARHVVMVAPETCAAMVTWENQARDYLLRPPRHDLEPGEVLTARVRHAIASVENETDLERLWSRFMSDQAAG